MERQKFFAGGEKGKQVSNTEVTEGCSRGEQGGAGKRARESARVARREVVHGRGHDRAGECEKSRRRARLARVDVRGVLEGMGRTNERGGEQCA